MAIELSRQCDLLGRFAVEQLTKPFDSSESGCQGLGLPTYQWLGCQSVYECLHCIMCDLQAGALCFGR